MADDLRTIEQLLHTHYGIKGTVKPLAGEYDLNFKVETQHERFLLKIARSGADRSELEFQNAVLNHVTANLEGDSLPVQQVIAAQHGEPIVAIQLGTQTCSMRLLSFLEGRTLAHVSPHTPELLESLGAAVARVDLALEGFSHPLATREFKWNLAQADGFIPKLELIEDEKRQRIAARHFETFLALKPRFHELPQSVIHGDANDHNVVVQGHGYEARVSGLIDFGDAMHCPTVGGLAIALAYAMLDKPDPLASAAHVVRGYQAIRGLSEREIEVLYPLILTRLAVSVTNSNFEKRLRPDDPYIVISEAPSWALLEHLETVHPHFAHAVLRHACGLEPVPNSQRVRKWLQENSAQIRRVVEADLRTEPLHVLDLGVASLELGLPEDSDTSQKFSRLVWQRITQAGHRIGIGRYNEPRLLYTSSDFETQGESGLEHRTMHIGLDVFLPAGAPVLAPLAGRVHSLAFNAAHLDYGACIVLEHRVDDGSPLRFYTLYGHLSKKSLELEVGQTIEAGQPFAWLGDHDENGGWCPHLHFQIITDLLGYNGTFPGVARPSDLSVWQSLSPDPNLITLIPAEAFPDKSMDGQAILQARRERIGKNLSISYRRPLSMARGHRQYLYDEFAQRYLDCYNNVPHVGHNHPTVVRAAQRQMAVLNTNTRYLHENIVRYAKALTDKLPEPLSVCFFVSSGSEATELALRLARAHTGQRDLIVSDHAYHGHTSTLIDISPYKAEGPGGQGLPDWVHKAPVPDDYQGEFRRGDPDIGEHYAATIDPILDRIRQAERGLCGFVIESIPSVGGQIVLPPGYLKGIYRRVRAAGGVCIADEVQTGFGRIGTHFWGFEHQEVVPDIVAMGKPIGNGYPLGAVVTTPEIAASFNNGMEFFATFGGNPVACAVGLATLEVIETQHLQRHALELGHYWMTKLRELQHQYPIIGDVRGLGLMNGLELVLDPETRTPAPDQADYVINRLRDFRILAGTDGPHHNVIKLRGPMVLTQADVDNFLTILSGILCEDAARA
jgi:4-aminobutyrate aminotransferase-like enzyme/Ser/Thr protein kinase RdoA (MazF antagonist)/murein DD-endopeptidase MepM/ murein hydrolase activator NlpD